MVLTIAIPTYNRSEPIRNTISLLLPQITSNVKVIVLDNCSQVDVKDYLQQTIGADVLNKVHVIRHRINIGGDANLQRCFELCETPYIWMLGDDDEVAYNAIDIIFSEIEEYEEYDLIGINFKSNLINRDTPILIRNTKDLSEKLDNFGNWSFISTSIYRTAAFVKYLYYASWGTYAMSSQLIPTMMAINNGKVFVLSEKYLVTNIPEQDVSKAWSPVQFALGLSAILEAPAGFKNNEHKSFANKLAVHFNCLYPGDAMCIIIRSVNYNINKIDNYHIYIFKQVILKTLDFRTEKFKQLTQYYICLFLMKHKPVLMLLFKIFPQIKRKSQEVAPFHLFVR